MDSTPKFGSYFFWFWDFFRYFFLVGGLLYGRFGWLRSAQAAMLRLKKVATLSGITSLHLLVALFGLTASTMTFGALQEIMNWRLQGQPSRKTMLPFWLGCIPHIFTWAIIGSYFFAGVSAASPPDWVWTIIFIQVLLDASFAVNMYLQQMVRTGPAKKKIPKPSPLP